MNIVRLMLLGCVLVEISCSSDQDTQPPAQGAFVQVSADDLSNEDIPADQISYRNLYKANGLRLSELTPLTKVSVLSLDSPKFLVRMPTIGLQNLMRSQSPVVGFLLPRDADYVQIFRCKSHVSLVGSLKSTSIDDLSISTMDQNELQKIYASTDFFSLAGQNKDCELITDNYNGGHANGSEEVGSINSYFDAFAPSGDFRYLIRACVHPSRLTDVKETSNRSCSRWVAATRTLKGYKNERSDRVVKARRKEAVQAAKIDGAIVNIYNRSQLANDAIDRCAVRERDRAVDLKVKEAWIVVAASVLEIGIEFQTVGQKGMNNILRHYTIFFKKKGTGGNWFSAIVDLFQLVAATEGVQLGPIFNQIFRSSEDMPRSCSDYKRHTDLFSLELQDLSAAYQAWTVASAQVLNAVAAQLAANGEDVGTALQISNEELEVVRSVPVDGAENDVLKSEPVDGQSDTE